MARGHMIGSRGWDADARVVQQRQTGEGGVCIETGDEEGGGEVGWGVPSVAPIVARAERVNPTGSS